MTNDRLQCLAIRQPWAWAVCIGAKDIESRTWTTEYRGLLAIQASAARQGVNALVKKSKGKLHPDEMPCGAIIGVVELVEVVPMDEALENNAWATGLYCWRFAHGRCLEEPIAYKGALHLYELPDDVASNIREQLTRKPLPRPKFADDWLSAMADDPFDLHADRCMSYRDLQDCARMVRAASQMIRSRPDLSDAFRLRGAGHFFGGNLAAGIVDLVEAVRLDPQDANAQYLLAWAYRDAGETAQSDAHTRSKWPGWSGCTRDLPKDRQTDRATLRRFGGVRGFWDHPLEFPETPHARDAS